MYQKEKKGNAYCGDSYYHREVDDGFICVIADGLGSGEFAKESSQVVIDILKEDIWISNDLLVKECNERLTSRRGVVLGILRIDYKEERYSFSSIGNIGLMTIDKDKKKSRNIPNRGYLAGYKAEIKELHGTLDTRMNFILFSDGVSDIELSQKYLLNRDVKEVIDTFISVNPKQREDDTTIIAIHYHA